MDKQATIAAIREEPLDIQTQQYMGVLNEFQLQSFSEKCLGNMSPGRLQDLLGRIRRLILLG